MSDSRERILARLRAAGSTSSVAVPRYRKPLGWDRAQRIAAFSARMRAVRGEVHRVAHDAWPEWLAHKLPRRGLRRVLVGTGTVGDRLTGIAADWQLQRYERPVEDWRDALFGEIDVAVTGSLAGLAESGSLVLWPDRDEPRLMSLVPPVHVAILDSGQLFENFAELVEAANWAGRMPTNALLISGPSKTADIEQTLAYGIHGPRQLITLLLE